MIASYEELRRNLWDICREIISFKNCLGKKAIPYSSHLPWVRLWEYSKAIAETGVSRGDVVLDAGGASTVFSYYLGKIGAICHTLDINEKLVKASVRANKRLGFYLFNSVQSITNLAYRDETFDYVFCIYVLEHIHYSEQEKAIRELSRVLKKGGSRARHYGNNI
jgi:ubiquinone/menaquinone biosynthesis C-methylase UbiE